MNAAPAEFRPVNACRACGQPTMQCVCESWVRDCPRCRGRGFNCIDDICHGKGYCIHGHVCAYCDGTGGVPPKRVLVVPDRTAAAARDYAREHPNLRKVKYARDDRDPLTGACYPVHEAYYHLREGALEVYCLNWADVDPAYDGTHWYLREPDGEERWIDLTIPLMPPIEFPPFEDGTHRGWLSGDEPSKRARKVIAAVEGRGA